MGFILGENLTTITRIYHDMHDGLGTINKQQQ